MAKILINIPEIEMTLDKLPDDIGSLDDLVIKALRAALKMQYDDVNDITTAKYQKHILSKHGLHKNPFKGRFWEISDV